jgi:hypothetical protein
VYIQINLHTKKYLDIFAFIKLKYFIFMKWREYIFSADRDALRWSIFSLAAGSDGREREEHVPAPKLVSRHASSSTPISRRCDASKLMKKQ